MDRLFDTRCCEVLSALISSVVAFCLLMAPDSAQVVQIMRAAMPGWAVVNIAASMFCVFACLFAHDSRVGTSARFLSGCLWGTFILIFASVGQWWLPIFGVAVVMFAFDVFLVTTKGQSWAIRANFSTTVG